MKIHRPITEPIRKEGSWDERWKAEDRGLIACWECGRKYRVKNLSLAAQASSGQLVVLGWKGGVEKAIKKKQKFGTLYYLAMWQGLRGEDLSIDPNEEISLTCTVTGMTVVYTADMTKYGEA